MTTLLYNILFAAVAAMLGSAAGWLIRGSGLRRSAPQKKRDRNLNGLADPYRRPTADIENKVQQEPDTQENLDAAEALMSRLHQFAENVAADVGKHNTRVEEINKELTSAGDGASVIAIVEKLVDANEKMQSQLNDAENQLQHQALEIETHVRDARTDALTKLLNRRAFDDELENAYHDLQETGKTCCVMLIDVDHFKKFNDTHGHQAGDEVLRGVARVLQQNTSERASVCRYGGEEFAIIYPGTKITDAISDAEVARAAIGDEPFNFDGLDMNVTASAGLGQLRDGETIERLIKRTDAALYVSKEEGRNCGHWHDGDTSHPMKVSTKPAQEAAPKQDLSGFKLTDDEPIAERRDRISGISSQRTFLDDVERRLAEQRRGGSTVSLLLVEIDAFQSIVEEFGPKAGDLVLRAGAQFLKATMRDMDHIARYKEHAFSLMLPGAGITETTSIAERLRGAVEKCKLPINGEQVGFTISIGAAEAVEDDDRASILQRASNSLDAANEAGGNVCFAITRDGDCRAMSFP